MIDITDWFEQNFDLRESTDGWFRFNMPGETGNASAVNFKYGRVKNFREDYGKSLIQFVILFTNKEFKEVINTFKFPKIDENKRIYRKLNVTYNTINLPDDYVSIRHLMLFPQDNVLAIRAIDYLKSRNLLNIAIDNYFGLSSNGIYMGRILIPILINSNIVGFTARTFINTEPKYINSDGFETSTLMYNQDIINTERKIYMVEGIFDTYATENGLALLGNHVSDIQMKLLINSNVEEIILIPDNGWYQRWLSMAVDLSYFFKIKVLNLDNTDFGDSYEAGKEFILDLENKTDYFKISDLFN